MHKEYDKVGKQNTFLIHKHIKIKSNVCPLRTNNDKRHNLTIKN